MPVDGLEGTVAETDTDGGASDAHTRRDRELVLGEDEDSDSGTHLHGATTRRRVVSDLVTHDLHDVVTVGDETEADGEGNDGDLPELDRDLLIAGLASAPGLVHGGPDTDSVTDIIGTVGERSSAGSDDLDEGVEMLDLIGVLGGVGVDTVHATSLRSTEDTDLGLVDVVVHTVESSDNDHGGQADEEGLEVVELVDGTGTHGVLVESSHGPAERASLLAELSVVALTGLGEEDLVIGLGVLGKGEIPLRVDVAATEGGFIAGSSGDDNLLAGGLDTVDSLLGINELGGSEGAVLVVVLTTVLHDSVVGNSAVFDSIGRSLALEQSRTPEDVVPLEGVVLLDDLGVDEGDEEDGGKDEQAEANAEGDGGNVPCGLVGQTETRRPLVDDGEGADGTGDEEEEGGGPDGPGDGVGAKVNDELDEHKDDGPESSTASRGHDETAEDGTETLAIVPSPLDTLGTDSRNTDTSNGGDERVGRADVGVVPGAPHDPGSGTSRSTGEGEKLNTGVAIKGGERDDATLDGAGGTGTDSQSTGQLEDETADHGPAVGDGAGGDRSGPGVGDIVGAIVVSLKKGEASADGKDVSVLGENHD